MNIKIKNSAKLKNLLISGLLIAFFVTIILSYYNMIYNQTREGIIKNGQSSAVQSKYYITEYFSTSVDAIKLTAYTIDGMIKNNKTNKEILDYLVGQSIAVTSTVFENTTGLYCYCNGEYLDGAMWVPSADFVPTERPWYIKAVAAKGEIAFIDPYLDAQTGNVAMTIAKCLSDGKSVVAMDITLDQVQTLTEESVKSGASDYEFILDSRNVVVAHSEKSEVGKNYNDEKNNLWNTILEKSKGAEDSFFEFKFEGKNYIVYVEQIGDNWRCIAVKNATEIFTPLNILLTVTMTIVILIVAILVYILNKSENRYNIAKDLNDQLSSLSNIYLSLYEINIAEDTFKVIKSIDVIDQELKEKNNLKASLLIQTVVEKRIDKISLDDGIKFIDFTTLNTRLKNTDTVAFEYQNKDLRWRRMRFIVSKRFNNGVISNVLWLVEDISEEKNQRDALINLSERAFAASEAKSSFLSNMSHEIRTPINTILGMNEMILRESKDTEIINYSENIQTAGNILLGIINDILDFSKIEAGKIEIIPVNYDLSSLINDLVNLIQPKVDFKGLELNLDFDKNLPKFLNGDEVRIKQIITNILTNAVKYTEKGFIGFSIGFERIESDPDSVILKIVIKDTGIGIKPEDMKKLFTEFERIEEERNRNVEGTGLGMAITKNLLNLMNSRLKVESIYDLGSKFSFELKQKVIKWTPLGDYETSYQETLQGRQKYSEKFTAPDAKILVVDDNQMNILVFKNLLKQTKLKIDTALSGNEGILLTKHNKYDIIFLDHMMPGKNGIETLQELRAQKNNQNSGAIVICLTANAISGAREKYISIGFDDYLTKPINPDKLEKMLFKYLPKDKILTANNDIDIKAETEIETPEKSENNYLNVKLGLQYSAGMIEVYKEILELFCNLKEEKKSDIQDAYKNKDWNTYTTLIHGLKSTALSIGGEQVAELAKKLEMAGHVLEEKNSEQSDKIEAENYIISHHAEAMDFYDKLVEEGKNYLSTEI